MLTASHRRLSAAVGGARAGRRHRSDVGFTVIELLCVVAMVGVLAALAYPSFQSAVRTSRRSEALATLMQLQAAQERYRANHAAYGLAADLGPPPVLAHYAIGVGPAGPDSYELRAVATGAQAADRVCKHLLLSVQGMNTLHASGPTEAHDNPEPENRQCWRL